MVEITLEGDVDGISMAKREIQTIVGQKVRSTPSLIVSLGIQANISDCCRHRTSISACLLQTSRDSSSHSWLVPATKM